MCKMTDMHEKQCPCGLKCLTVDHNWILSERPTNRNMESILDTSKTSQDVMLPAIVNRVKSVFKPRVIFGANNKIGIGLDMFFHLNKIDSPETNPSIKITRDSCSDSIDSLNLETFDIQGIDANNESTTDGLEKLSIHSVESSSSADDGNNLSPYTIHDIPDILKQAPHTASSRRRMSLVDHLKLGVNRAAADLSRRLSVFNRRPSEELDEDEKWLRWIQQQFAEIAGDDGEIDLAEFKGALGVKKSFFAERFFSLFDQDKSGSIELHELMDGLHMLTKGSPKQKLKFLFDVYDVDGSGTIEPDELKTVLASCMEESSIQLPEEKLQELTDTLFNAADEDGSGEITFDELVAELEKHPGVLENLTISAASWLKPPAKKKAKSRWPRYLTKNYIQNNVRKVVFYFIYLFINIALFALSIYRYRESNWCVIVARGCGMCLNFNGAFILVLMLRHTLTALRNTKIGSLLPLDQSISIHKMVGINIFLLSAVHTLAHLGNIGYVLHDAPDNSSLPNYGEFLFTLKSKIGYVGPGFAYLSGIILDIVLTIMVICSMPFVRRSGYFQVFYWTHMLYIVFWIFLILHGPIFWYFFIIPGIIFIIESIIKSKPVKLARYGRIYIKEVNLLPSGVTNLVITKSPRFAFMPGDYVFINIPAIADYEWHPFTISSAPENPDVFWLHVRSAGHWTGKLYEYFKNYEPLGHDNDAFTLNMEGDSKALEVKFNGKASKREKSQNETFATLDNKNAKSEGPKVTDKHKFTHVQCFIDGPYGTATREIFETEHAVLIGSGIGVTPYASILQSVMFRYQAMRRQCPKCNHVWFGQMPASVMKLKKVDFIWINRSQHSFEWFVSLLAKIEMQQAEIHAGHSSLPESDTDSGNIGGEETSSGGTPALGDKESNNNIKPECDNQPDNFIDMQMYITSALSKNDMKGMALQMAMEMMHKDGGVDVITGLKTRTQPGRPKWPKVFADIDRTKKGKVKVFFCGAPVVAKQLKAHCEEKGFEFGKENF